MKTHHSDLTIDEALTDPMIRSVMQADGVEPRQLEAMLRTMAAVQKPRLQPYGLTAWAAQRLPPPRGAPCGSPCAW